MKPKIYFKDQQGRKLRKSETNTHHVAFYSPDYNKVPSSLEHRYRHIGGFLIRMSIPYHNDLHDNIRRKTPKPNECLMADLVDYDRSLDGRLSNYEKLVKTMGYLEVVAATAQVDYDAWDADKLLTHLRSQREFIDPGHVELWTPEPVQLMFTEME
jgi:hypothetical protein